MTTKKANSQVTLREWLKALAPHDSFASLVLKNGVWCPVIGKVADYEEASTWRKRRRPRAKDCLFTAQRFCAECPGVNYFEGYYLAFGVPNHHAWVVMEDGVVVDFTHEAALRKAKRMGVRVEEQAPLYLGLHVPRKVVQAVGVFDGFGQPIAEVYFNGMQDCRKLRS